MAGGDSLYRTCRNPLIIRPARAMPRAMAVVGAGTIGPDIAYYLKTALPGSKLYLVDVDQQALDRAAGRHTKYAEKAVHRKKMSPQAAQEVLSNVVYTTDYGLLKDCDLVIESATENVSVKQAIFKKIESVVRADAIITSNTSSIPADRIFGHLEHPERTTVTHFFAPAWSSPVVEVVSWKAASQEVIDYLFWFFGKTGKVPMMTANVIAFMFDRIFDNWCNDAAYLLEHATAAEIGSAVEKYVHQGPFYILNLGNGNSIVAETNGLLMEEGEHYAPAPILRSVDQWRVPRPGTPVPMSEEKRSLILDRMLGLLFSQCFDIVDRGIGTIEDLNYGCQASLGFKRGPFDIMQDLGEAEVLRIVDKYAADRPGFPRPKRAIGEYLGFRRHILVDDVGDVKVITIRRPQALNALNHEITGEILASLKAHADDPSVRGFVITGYGDRAFSAGADIGRFPEILGDREAAAQFARDGVDVQLFLDRCEKPVVAAVGGMALGGGLELAIRCHSIVCTANARFQLPEISLGILPGIGGCVVPYRKWPQGASIFHDMICLGRAINAQEAAAIGMVVSVESDYAGLIASAVDEVRRLEGSLPRMSDGPVELPPIQLPSEPMAGAVKLSRQAVGIAAKTVEKAAAARTFAEALEVGYQGFGEVSCTAAAREGISAFLEKRPAVFEA
ncbi:MAG: enoyl-CoA hydratase/isomerase family protein [Deltaproteobacteria bacterium]|nr:enoyl-CoA hydratase/isomerase family protein [Deltaproteobacteria bacterium]